MLRTLAIALGLSLLTVTRVAAAPSVAGTWSGMIEFEQGHPLLFVITISQNGAGLSATATSPYQGAGTIPVDAIAVNGNTLTFSIKNVEATYTGSIGVDSVNGSFTQYGKTTPLILTPSSVGTSTMTGTWIGVLTVGSNKLLLALHVQGTPAALTATLDSPYQQGFGIPVTSIAASNKTLTFSIANIGASFTGKIGASDIDGTFTQNGQSFPLKFARP